MGLMDLLKTSDPMDKFYAAAERSNIPQGGVTGAMFKGMFPHGAGNVLFGRKPEPMPPLESPEGTAFMADLASNMMVPGTFIGVGGMMKQMGRDKAGSLLAKADSALKGGASKESVFKELGVFRGPEGKWRYEIDDSPSQFLATDGGGGVLSDFLLHSDIYSAYPDVQRIKTMFEPSSTGGAYNWTQDSMEIGGGSPHSIALHELQHAVQGREGFAAGGSPSQFSGAGEMVNNISGDMKIAPDVVEFWRRVDSGIPRKQAGEGLDRNAVINALGFSDGLEARAWADGLEKQMNEWSDIAIDPFSAYQRLAGEAEARAVQDRMNMPMSERRSIFPDYAKRDDLIIRGLMNP